MTINKILVRKEKETGKVLYTQLLFDDDTTEHVIIDHLPLIEEREGFRGEYQVNEDGTVEVVYTEIPLTAMEIMQKKLDEQEKLVADLMLLVAGGVK